MSGVTAPAAADISTPRCAPYRFIRVLRLQVQQLRDRQVAVVVVYGARDADDALLQQARVYVIRALAARAAFDHHRHIRHAPSCCCSAAAAAAMAQCTGHQRRPARQRASPHWPHTEGLRQALLLLLLVARHLRLLLCEWPVGSCYRGPFS